MSVLASVAWVTLTAAQTAWADGRLEVSARGGWCSGYALGVREATITGGQIPTGLPVVLFATDVALQGGPAGEVGVGWRVARRIVLEATGALSRLHLESRIRGDLEGASALTARSSLLQVTVEGGARLDLPATFGHGRLRPFVTGGGGYLRQVHERRLLVETGRTVFVGGGLVVFPSRAPARGVLSRLGFRADVRGVLRTGGVDIEDETRTFLAVTGGVVVGFW